MKKMKTLKQATLFTAIICTVLIFAGCNNLNNIAAPTDPVAENPTADAHKPATEAATDNTDPPSEKEAAETKEAAEQAAEPVTDPITDPATEEIAEAATEPITQATTDPVAYVEYEPTDEPTDEADLTQEPPTPELAEAPTEAPYVPTPATVDDPTPAPPAVNDPTDNPTPAPPMEAPTVPGPTDEPTAVDPATIVSEPTEPTTADPPPPAITSITGLYDFRSQNFDGITMEFFENNTITLRITPAGLGLNFDVDLSPLSVISINSTYVINEANQTITIPTPHSAINAAIENLQAEFGEKVLPNMPGIVSLLRSFVNRTLENVVNNVMQEITAGASEVVLSFGDDFDRLQNINHTVFVRR